MRRFVGSGITAAIPALVVSLLLALAAPAPAAFGEDKFKVGDTAPDFTLKELAGGDVQLSSFKGAKVVLLNFWGLRCGACLEELPYLEDLHKRYAGQGLVVLGVDTDGVDAATIKATMAEVKASVSYPVLVDTDFTATDTYTNFLVPLTIVIDRKGVITYLHTGFEKGTEKHYEAAVKKALDI
jgi:peroxiredoxin